MREERKQKYATLRDLPARTLDGADVALHINAGLLIDMQHLKTAGADGVGLYRTEIPFMVRSEFPDAEAQALLYGRILDQADGKPVVFRTLDVGGDKVLPYLGEFGDDNPAMGWRAIRIGLDRPALLRQQLRALIVAARGRDLAIMFPMVSTIDEFDAARRVLELEMKRQIARGHKRPARLKVGVMLEVPALLYQMDELFKRIDFLSVGSNDLLQFMFAADRGNPRLSDRYDALSPASLRLFADIAKRAAKAQDSGQPVRGNGRETPGSAGAAGGGLAVPVDESGQRGAGQGHGPQPRSAPFCAFSWRFAGPRRAQPARDPARLCGG